MEKLVKYSSIAAFYKGKKVFLTGHTGFKGSWLANWLQKMGAEVCAFALPPATNPNQHDCLKKEGKLLYKSIFGDVNDFEHLLKCLRDFQPEILFHLAAQPLVRESYTNPRENHLANYVGTLNVLEAARFLPSLRAAVFITTDKVYENQEWLWGYRENDALGGHDPYSASKAACEILIQSYRRSFFNPEKYGIEHQFLLASARAGNVIGGGDWQKDRLIPDLVRSISSEKPLEIRSPFSVRPWQHVLEPLWGYLLLAERLFSGEKTFAEAWNFADAPANVFTVKAVAEQMQKEWHKISNIHLNLSGNATNLKESKLLLLDSSKAGRLLHWHSSWNFEKTIRETARWYRIFEEENFCLTDEQTDLYIQSIS
jgi:CDP-glucose 4,6-dehydratase